MGPTSTRRRVSGLVTLAAAAGMLLTLILGAAPAHAAGDDADITSEFACDAVEVSSSKDISNVVVRFADGSTERFEGLSGRTWSRVFDREVDGVWVKSGDNKSGDGPGYGEWFASDADCGQGRQPTGGQGPDGGTEPDGAPDRPVRETSQGSTAAITVDLDCFAVTVESTKDISNVVVQYADGSTEKFDGLSGRSWSRVFDREIDGVWVKSGDNKSGDGPGYGEWFAGDADCDEGQAAPDQTPDGVVDTTPDRSPPDAPAADVPADVSGDVEQNGAAPGDQPASEGDAASAPAPDTAVLGVTIERPVAAAGPDAEAAGLQAEAAPTALALTGADGGWLLAVAAALAVYGIIALDLTGRRAGRRA